MPAFKTSSSHARSRSRASARGRDPGERIEPIESAGQLRERLRPPISSPNVGQLVQQRRFAIGRAPFISGVRQQNHRTKETGDSGAACVVASGEPAGISRKPRRAARRRASFVHSRGASVARAACQPLASHPRRNHAPRIQVPARANASDRRRGRMESTRISLGRHPPDVDASHGATTPNAAGACSTAGDCQRRAEPLGDRRTRSVARQESWRGRARQR